MAEGFPLAVNIVQIISACASTTKQLDHQIYKFGDKAAKLNSLAAKASLVKVILQEIDKALHGRPAFYAKKIDEDIDLKSAVNVTLTGGWIVFLLLQQELKKWVHAEGKDAKLLQNTGPLDQNKIIQDYITQIETYIQALKIVLLCLQAQTVAETHEILRQANRTLESIAKVTLKNRGQYTYVALPESLYDHYTTCAEDEPFDKRLLESRTYRAAWSSAGKNRVPAADALMTTKSTQARKDFLSDQPLNEERQKSRVSINSLESGAIGDLISFDDYPMSGLQQPASPNVQLLADLAWESSSTRTKNFDRSNAGLETYVPTWQDGYSSSKSGPDEGEHGRHSPEVRIGSLLDDMLQDSAQHNQLGEDIQPELRRDSGRSAAFSSASPFRQGQSLVPTIVRPDEDPAVPSWFENPLDRPIGEEGLIRPDSEHELEPRTARTSSISKAGITQSPSAATEDLNLISTPPTPQISEVVVPTHSPDGTEETTIPYRLYWTCNCGHKNYDDFVETIPDSLSRFVYVLQENGVEAQVELQRSDPVALELYQWYYPLRNTVASGIKTAAKLWQETATQRPAQPSIPMSSGAPSQSSASKAAGPSGQQSTQPLNLVQGAGNRVRNTIGGPLGATAQQLPLSTALLNDHMLLCSDGKGWLTTREDLDVSQIKSDRELFGAFKYRLNRRKRWASRCISLKSIQRISFVKFAIRRDQEVDQIQVNHIPPQAESHYDFHERVPGFVPPIGNRYLMHRFSNPAHCRDTTFCLAQIPKRVQGRPQYGSAPDHFTGWGLYFQEAFDMTRLCFCSFVAFVLSLTFGVAWAVDRKNIQEGFAVASYVLALEALTIGAIQVAVEMDWL